MLVQLKWELGATAKELKRKRLRPLSRAHRHCNAILCSLAICHFQFHLFKWTVRPKVFGTRNRQIHIHTQTLAVIAAQSSKEMSPIFIQSIVPSNGSGCWLLIQFGMFGTHTYTSAHTPRQKTNQFSAVSGEGAMEQVFRQFGGESISTRSNVCRTVSVVCAMIMLW